MPAFFLPAFKHNLSARVLLVLLLSLSPLNSLAQQPGQQQQAFSQEVFPQAMPPSSPQPILPQNNAGPTLRLGGASQAVPQGTMLTIAFNNQLDARVTQKGEPFTAMLTDNFYVSSSQVAPRLILPRGTLIRGRVGEVKRPNWFSQGGAIALEFDHIVLPSGDLLPLTLKLSAQQSTGNHSGAQATVSVKQFGKQRETLLYADPGVGVKMSKGVDDGVKTFKGITQKGIEAGKQTAGGAGVIVTAPLAAVGGAVVGTGVTTGKAVTALVGKGQTVEIHPGDRVTIDFGGSFVLPAQ